MYKNEYLEKLNKSECDEITSNILINYKRNKKYKNLDTLVIDKMSFKFESVDKMKKFKDALLSVDINKFLLPTHVELMNNLDIMDKVGIKLKDFKRFSYEDKEDIFEPVKSVPCVLMNIE